MLARTSESEAFADGFSRCGKPGSDLYRRSRAHARDDPPGASRREAHRSPIGSSAGRASARKVPPSSTKIASSPTPSSMQGANRFARWASAQGLAQGRCRIAADGEPARISDGLDRTAQERLHRRARSTPISPDLRSAIRSTSPARNISSSAASWSTATRRAVLGVEVPPRLWATGGAVQGCEDLDAALAAQSARTARRQLARRSLLPRQGALHLHLGHDRPAQGREHQPHAAAAHHDVVPGRGERQARRPHV